MPTPGMLRWPFRVMIYVMMYIFWAMISLFILTEFPHLTYDQSISILPAGWLPIAGVFLADVYFTQLRHMKAP